MEEQVLQIVARLEHQRPAAKVFFETTLWTRNECRPPIWISLNSEIAHELPAVVAGDMASLYSTKKQTGRT
jgi:hypothetical protein